MNELPKFPDLPRIPAINVPETAGGRTVHTMTIRFTVEPNIGDPSAPAGSVDLDIEAIEIDGEDVAPLSTGASYSEAQRHIRNALNILEG